MEILYIKYDKKNDQAFLVRWPNGAIMFDCYSDKWRKAERESIDKSDLLNIVDPMDLKMAGSYISLYEDKVDFPEGIRREFIKFTFSSRIEKL